MVGHWSYPIFASQETTKPEYSILQALSTKNQMIHTKTGGLITQNQTTWHIKSPTAPLQFRDDCFGISSRRTAYRHGFGEVSYCDIHHGQFVVRHIQQCTRLPILGQAEHGVQRAGGETVRFQRIQQRHGEQATIHERFVTFAVVHERADIRGYQQQYRWHGISMETTLNA